MSERTPDQIRRATTPQKHYAFKYGCLAGVLGGLLSFGIWGLLHQEQVKRYPAYELYALRSEFSSFSLFGKSKTEMSDDQLRYSLLRFGNLDHRYDSEIVRRGWYPRGENGKTWVYYNGAVAPVYSDSVPLVFMWPATLTLLFTLGAVVWGQVADYRYRLAIVAGVPLDGSIIATVDEYNERTKGDGMAYAVKPWEDR